MLAGCGGRGGGDDQLTASTGVLHSSIRGVSYRTTTQSGKTDANGAFRYLPGETVTFSIGSIELGAVPGGANISLFTLAGTEPITNELALRRDLDRMRYVPTPLSRAANRAMLLLALDDDANPANGIDVSSFDSALAAATLSFDARIYDFQQQVSRLAPGVTSNIPTAFAIKWLYRSAGVKLAGSVPVRALEDEHDDGVFDSIAWSEVDSSGETVASFFDQDADGQPDVTVTYQRDSLGMVTRQRTVRDFDLDHQPDSDHLVVTTYDSHGNAIRVTESEDGGADGSIDAVSSADYDFDAYGRLLGSAHRFDNDNDGTPDATERVTLTRDARGNLLRQVSEVDDDADGQVDSRYTTDNSWDAAGRQLSVSYQSDLDGDGVAETTRRQSVTYGATGPGQTYDEEYDGDGDGVFEQHLVTRYTYDTAGNITSRVSDYQDSWGAYRVTGVSTYGADRRPLTIDDSYDYDIDGTVDSATSQILSYDANGFQLASEYRSSYFGTGPGGWLDFTRYSYSAMGAQQAAVSGTDFDGDGVPELSRRNVIEYAPSNDAMAQIVDQYFGL